MVGFYPQRPAARISEYSYAAILNADYFSVAGRCVDAAVFANGRVFWALVISQVDTGRNFEAIVLGKRVYKTPVSGCLPCDRINGDRPKQKIRSGDREDSFGGPRGGCR